MSTTGIVGVGAGGWSSWLVVVGLYEKGVRVLREPRGCAPAEPGTGRSELRMTGDKPTPVLVESPKCGCCK